MEIRLDNNLFVPRHAARRNRQHNPSSSHTQDHHRLQSLDDIGWYGSAYLLSITALQEAHVSGVYGDI